MLSWVVVWDVFKVAIFPVVGLLYAMFKQKIVRLEHNIDVLTQTSIDLDKKLIRLENTMVTQEQVRDLLASIQKSMEKSNEGLEKRLEKTIDLNISPLKDLISKLVDKK